MIFDGQKMNLSDPPVVQIFTLFYNEIMSYFLAKKEAEKQEEVYAANYSQ